MKRSFCFAFWHLEQIHACSIKTAQTVWFVSVLGLLQRSHFYLSLFPFRVQSGAVALRVICPIKCQDLHSKAYAGENVSQMRFYRIADHIATKRRRRSTQKPFTRPFWENIQNVQLKKIHFLFDQEKKNVLFNFNKKYNVLLMGIVCCCCRKSLTLHVLAFYHVRSPVIQ